MTAREALPVEETRPAPDVVWELARTVAALRQVRGLIESQDGAHRSDSDYRSLLEREGELLDRLWDHGLGPEGQLTREPTAAGPGEESTGDAVGDRRAGTDEGPSGDLVARVAQLKESVSTRTAIGRAQGILMERHRMTAEQAFERLRAISQHSNRRLVEIAVELAATGVELRAPSMKRDGT